MEHFAHGIIIVLLHHIWEHRTARHFTHRQVMYLGENLVYRQDEWCREVLVIYHVFVFITQRPSNPHYGRTEFEHRNRLAQQNDGGTSDSAINHYSSITQKLLYRPCIHLSCRNTTVHLLEHHLCFGNGDFIQIIYRSIRHDYS